MPTLIGVRDRRDLLLVEEDIDYLKAALKDAQNGPRAVIVHPVWVQDDPGPLDPVALKAEDVLELRKA